VWAVQDDGGITSSNGNERRGVFVQFPARQNSYITQWGWASSHTSGGHGGTDNYPVDVCVDARYRMFDPVTHQLTGPEIESGNCSSRGYADPSWVRGVVRADNGKFLTNVWQFQFGNDAKLHGAKLTRRTLIYGSYDATPQNPLPLRNPLNIGTTYPAVLTMRNTGNIAWPSEREISRSHQCDNWGEGSPEDPICTYTRTVTSDIIKLRRVDTGTSVQAVRLGLPSSPNTIATEFPYSRVITVTKERRTVTEVCTGVGGGPQTRAGGSLWSRIKGAVIPVVYAAPPIDWEPCIPQEVTYVSETETPSVPIVNGSTGDFGFSATAVGPAGTYDLKFQMVKADSNELFGDIATVPVTVNSVGPGIGLSCQTVEQVVAPGEVASYTTVVTSQGGFSGPISVSVVDGLPAGASSPGANGTLAASSTLSLIVPVVTTSTTPAGSSLLTFEARSNSSSTSPQRCTSVLTVVDDTAPKLTVTPPNQSVARGGSVPYDAWYDPDGSGPASSTRVTLTADWDSSSSTIASPESGGMFRGNELGIATIHAHYTGTAGPVDGYAAINVVDGGPATLVVNPSSRTIGVDGIATYSALFDPDGGGPLAPQPVTDTATWESGNTTYATSQGRGSFRGVAIGTTVAMAHYSGLTAAADLVVAANQPTLTIDPPAQSIGIGNVKSFSASYDPDGIGPQGAQTVTGDAAWESGNPSIANSLGGGTYHGNVQGNTNATARYSGLTATANIAVTDNPVVCSFTASPSSLFIPPLRSTLLSWSCDHPTSCIVTNQTDPPFGQVATGNQTGSGQATPRHSTTYRLSCDSGNTIIDKLVRVFDVTTRIEILPR
jgi:hypothetical protein